MRIGMLVPSLENKGPIIVARNIAKYLKNDIEIVFISLRKNNIDSYNNFLEFEVYELDLGKIPVLLNRKKLITKIKEIDVDIIHCHSYWPTILSGLFLRQYCIISTLHNNPNMDYTYEYGSALGKIMGWTMLKCQNTFFMNVAISDYIKKIHLDMGIKKKKIMTIYNGIEINNIIEKKEKKSNNGKIKLITVSVLNKIKNIEFLIDVVEEMVQKNIIVTLKIIGDGNFKQVLEKRINDKKLNKFIKLLGSKTRKEIDQELKKADVFVFSSKNEGLGLSVLEALSAEIPVVTSDIPVMKEIIENDKNGYICEVKTNFYIEKILKVKKNINDYNIVLENKFLISEMSSTYKKLYKLAEKFIQQERNNKNDQI